MPLDPMRRSHFKFPTPFSMARFLRDLHCQEPGHLAEAARGNIGTLIVTVLRKESDDSDAVEKLAAEWQGVAQPDAK